MGRRIAVSGTSRRTTAAGNLSARQDRGVYRAGTRVSELNRVRGEEEATDRVAAKSTRRYRAKSQKGRVRGLRKIYRRHGHVANGPWTKRDST